jgi:CBS domain containing-hemolysin-like protein
LSEFILHVILKQDVSVKDHNIVFGKVDLDHFISQAQNVNQAGDEIQQEIRIFQNALDFSDVKIRECSVPRTEIVAIDVQSTIGELRNKFVNSGLSRIIIYEDNIDNVIGYVRSSELFKSPLSIRSVMTEIPVVPESMPAGKLLEQFMKKGRNIAVVVDEFGGTSGIVTSEDIIEEIFGEIEDEHDKTALEERQVSDDEFIFSGRLEIDYLNEKYKLGIEESDEYNTLAGYILVHHHSMPDVNESFTVENYFVTVVKVTSTKIELIRLRRINNE